MKNNTRLSIKEEIEKDVIMIEKTILSRVINDVEASREMDKSLYKKIEKYNEKHNFNVELSEELVPNFPERTNDNSEIFLSEEDKEALRLGRELMKNKMKMTLHEVSTELHKHLNYEKERIHEKNKSHKNSEET